MANESGESAAARAREEFDAVQNDPTARLDFARRFYVELPNREEHAYGHSELAFMKWEIDRGVLNPIEGTAHPGSPWWRQVNAILLVEAQEAFILSDEGKQTGSNQGTDAWLRFIADPSPHHWYQAHDTSICRGYLTSARLASEEIGLEQKLMNIVLYRVLFTQAVVDRQPWILGPLTRIVSPLVAPDSPLVTYVVKDRSLYPNSYPLDAEDRATLERRFNSLGNILAAIVDLAVIRPRLARLFTYIASDLELPEVELLCRSGTPCYPWGLNLDQNQLDAIDTADRPGLAVRLLTRLLDRFGL